LVLISSQQLFSQISPNEFEEECCKYCIHGDHQSGSPYTINFKNEIPYFATSLGLLGTGFLMKEINGKTPFTVDELDDLDPSNINSFDKGAIFNNSLKAREYSNYTLISGALLPLYFLSNHHTKKDFLPLLVMGVEVFSITSALTLNTKYAFNRTRPLAYNPEFSNELRTDETSRISFFSGHTAQTAGFSFFMAKVITDYHPNMKLGTKTAIWSFAIALPAVTGYFRVKGGKHFNTDVITGFAIGGAIGWLVPHLHKTKKPDSKLTMSPFNYNRATGLSLSLKL
jgi:membrane-associated phospholipid phosphatase